MHSLRKSIISLALAAGVALAATGAGAAGHRAAPALNRARAAQASNTGATMEDRVRAVIPEFEGKHGHPIIIGREMIEAFLRAPASATARETEHEHQEKIDYLALNDPHVTLNVDTLEQYAELTKHPPAAKTHS